MIHLSTLNYKKMIIGYGVSYCFIKPISRMQGEEYNNTTPQTTTTLVTVLVILSPMEQQQQKKKKKIKKAG